MSFVDDHLMEGETVQYRTRLHWIHFFWPILWFLVGLSLLNGFDVAVPIGAIVAFISFAWFIDRIIVYFTSEFAVTNRRVLFKVGFIRRHSSEIMLCKMEMIAVNQSILGRILGYGTIVVGGSGGTKNNFANITAPMELRLNVQKQVDIIQG